MISWIWRILVFFSSVRSGQIRNVESAKVSMVGQVKRLVQQFYTLSTW